jgi:hypothetical protein
LESYPTHDTMKHAFKEWAVICKALAEGKQALILRKGGIAEDFQLVQTRFWLFPTYTHQQREGIREEARPLLEQIEAERPPAGTLRISHYAEVTGVYHVHDLTPALCLAHLHYWSSEIVEKRFTYRAPGIYVMPVRVYRAAQVFELPDSAHYEGCRTWVELDRDLPTDGAAPVISDKEMHDLHRSLDLLLNPTALA